MPDLDRPSMAELRSFAGSAARLLLVGAAAATSVLALPTTSVMAGTEPERPSIEEATDEGAVVIATSEGEPASNGGSATPFRVILPEGAACPGDTASNNWLVQTFLIPAGDDPGTVEYGVIGPEGTQFPLYAIDTRPVAHQVTRIATVPDGEGVINALPDLSFAVFPPEYIPPGEYTIGVACTFFRQTARYWDAPIVIEADPDDEPARLSWRLPDAAPFESPTDDDSGTGWWLWGGGAAVVIAAAVLIIRRRRAPRSPSIGARPEPRDLARTSR